MQSVPQISWAFVHLSKKWMAGPISYSLEVIYTLARTMPQTDEGYNMLPVPALSIFRVILVFFLCRSLLAVANFSWRKRQRLVDWEIKFPKHSGRDREITERRRCLAAKEHKFFCKTQNLKESRARLVQSKMRINWLKCAACTSWLLIFFHISLLKCSSRNPC